jgi:hypothetical protein
VVIFSLFTITLTRSSITVPRGRPAPPQASDAKAGVVDLERPTLPNRKGFIKDKPIGEAAKGVFASPHIADSLWHAMVLPRTNWQVSKRSCTDVSDLHKQDFPVCDQKTPIKSNDSSTPIIGGAE